MQNPNAAVAGVEGREGQGKESAGDGWDWSSGFSASMSSPTTPNTV